MFAFYFLYFIFKNKGIIEFYVEHFFHLGKTLCLFIIVFGVENIHINMQFFTFPFKRWQLQWSVFLLSFV